MAETAESQPVTDAEEDQLTNVEKMRVIVNRVLNLSIFFVGIGVYAVAGFGLRQTGVFAGYQLTYFAVGVFVGVVGILLWLTTR